LRAIRPDNQLPVSLVTDVFGDAGHQPFGVVSDIIVSESYFYFFFHLIITFFVCFLVFVRAQKLSRKPKW
jgi:hypothetical protein